MLAKYWAFGVSKPDRDAILAVKPPDEVIAFQFVNPNGILSAAHLEHGIHHALRTFHEKTMIARDLGLEILLRMSGQRQISVALSSLGLPASPSEVVLVAVANDQESLDQAELLLQEQFDLAAGDMKELSELKLMTESEAKCRHNLHEDAVVMLGVEGALLEVLAILEVN